MIKKLISLAVASASTLALAGCGPTEEIPMDSSLMGDGTSNKTGLGGYWWTYVDRSGKSEVSPDTGKSDPMNTTTRPATSILKSSIGPGVGIEEGAFHVTGKVGVAPKYNDTTVYDAYWDAFYGPASQDAPNVCGADGCLEMKYPAVGIGFGFKAKNVPLGVEGAKGKIGLVFKMKLGATHPAASPINVSLPMDVTDVPDPTFEDQFGSKFAGVEPQGNAAPGTNTPICTFPGTLKDDGTQVGSTNKTCFANPTTDGTQTNIVADLNTSTFTTVCLKWSAFANPSWAATALSNPSNPVPVNGVIPERIIKMQFDAFKPLDTATEAVIFDFWVDDVYLADQAKWDTLCAPATGAKVYGT